MRDVGVDSVGPAQDRADPGVRVLQVRRRVALERQHPIPVEHVVLDPIGRQVGVLQRADADHPADVDLLVGGQVRVLLARPTPSPARPPRPRRRQNRTGSPLRLFNILRSRAEHVAEARRARLAPAVAASPPSRRRRTPSPGAATARRPTTYSSSVALSRSTRSSTQCQIAGAVVEAAAALLHDQRQRLALAIGVAGRNTTSAPSLSCQQPGGRAAARRPRAADRLYMLSPARSSSVSSTPSLRYSRLKCCMLRSTSSFHSAQCLGSPLCSMHDALASPILELLAGVELGSGLLVEPVEIADAELAMQPRSRRCRRGARSACPNGVPQSPTWFSRITVWPTNFEHAHQSVADHRGAQVADVHLLGDVGRRVVDDDALRRSTPCRTPRRSSACAASGVAARNAVVERDVDEAGPGDFERRLAGEIGGGDDVVGAHRAACGRAAWPARAPLAWASARSLGRTTGSTSAVAAGDRGERRCQQVGDDDEGSAMKSRSVLVRDSFDMPVFAAPCAWRCGFVAILAGIPPS